MKRHIKMIRQAAFVAFTLSAVFTAQAQKASTTYRATARDPFKAWRPAPKKKAANVPTLVAPPAIQARIDAYKAQKAMMMNMQMPAPKPTTALLLSELQLTGVFRTPRGYAAMVEATPIKLSFVVYPGEKFYDGMLVAIEENRLVCRKETRWSDGRRELGVEFKPLGQANAVRDALTASGTPEKPRETPKEKAAAAAKSEESAAVKQ